MQNYKNTNNQIHVLDSTEFEHLLPAGCVKITQAQADAIRVAEEAAKPVIIPTLSMRQARLALLNMGLLTAVQAAITTDEQHIWWEYSPTVERSNPLVIAVLSALGKTSAEIDAMFISAALI